MSKTPIQWTDFSVNPLRAQLKDGTGNGHFCEKISPGCKFCYSSKLQPRFNMLPFLAENREKVDLFFDREKALDVLRRKKPTKYFWCDMTDIFLDGYQEEWLDFCFTVMALTGQHVHQVLTKRPERMLEYMLRLSKNIAPLEAIAREIGYSFKFNGHSLLPWPIPNIQLGVSVENRDYLRRVDVLRMVPARVRFLSIEPLLADISTLYLSGIHWVIVGGESGPNARPFDDGWARSIVRQCRAAGVPCFVKQLGAHVITSGISGPGEHWPTPVNIRNQEDDRFRVHLQDHKGGDMSEWPEDIRVREYPCVNS